MSEKKVKMLIFEPKLRSDGDFAKKGVEEYEEEEGEEEETEV